MSISKEVVDTIVTLAAEKVRGVVAVGDGLISGGVNKLFGAKQKPASGIEVAVVDNTLALSLRLTIFYGYPIKELAEEIRCAVANAVQAQVGAQVSAIDIFVDHIVIPKE